MHQYSQLGKPTQYVDHYDASLLFPIPRSQQRDSLSWPKPFQGVDVWHAYELSWLNEKGKPQVAIGEFRVPADSPNLIESKSFKLYCNSFNQSRFDSRAQVAEIMMQDLSKAAGDKVQVTLRHPSEYDGAVLQTLPGLCIDDQDIAIEHYTPQPSYLSADVSKVVSENLISYLLKSSCLVTGQPDWATVQIQYHGPKLDQAGLLKYIVSFRQHQEFHEHCIERIFVDLMHCCQPEMLTVCGRYTRRGGLDISPLRTNTAVEIVNIRDPRQ